LILFSIFYAAKYVASLLFICCCCLFVDNCAEKEVPEGGIGSTGGGPVRAREQDGWRILGLKSFERKQFNLVSEFQAETPKAGYHMVICFDPKIFLYRSNDIRL
jgi:hypothetical protein